MTNTIKLELELERIRIERDGMVAENMQRQFQGDAMAYGEANFSALLVK